MINEPHKHSSPLSQPSFLNRNWRFILFNAVFASALFAPLRDLIRTTLSSDYDSYIPFIPFIVAYLIYSERQTIFAERKMSPWPGLLAAGIGALFLFIGLKRSGMLDHRDYLAITAFSLVMIWTGGFAFFHGLGAARKAVFPLLFLFFAVPIPGAVLDWIIVTLQTGSTEMSYALLKLAVPVARDGFVFHLPTIDVEVARQCSGIRSSLSLMITGILAAYMFLRTWWARAVLLALILPIAIVKNSIRIFSLTTLGVYWDVRILESDLHTRGGFIFFIIALMMVWGVIALLRKRERRVLTAGNQAG